MGNVEVVIDDERARVILSIEGAFWRYPGAKEAAVSDRLGMTSTAYYQAVNQLLDSPSAVIAQEFGPVLNRLRRVRAQRLQQRVGRRSA